MTPSSGESIGLAALRIMQVFQANRSSTFVWRGFPRAKKDLGKKFPAVKELALLYHIPIPKQTDLAKSVGDRQAASRKPERSGSPLKLAPVPLANLTCHQSVFIYDYQRLYVL